jgi:hypothetical protein
MSRVCRALATALLLLCGNALLADEPIEAILVVPDLRILPGVPFDFWVELHNRSEDVRRVSVCAPFQMRLLSGEPIQWTDTRDQRTPRSDFYWSHGGEAVVQPGETAFLAIPAHDGLTAGGFFRDRRLSAPGRRFAIALPLCGQVIGAYGSPGERSTLTTSEVEIEIMRPTAGDAKVWNLIQQTSKYEWTAADMGSPDARAMWKSVVRNFPDSNYVPYAILMTGSYSNDWRDSLARELRAIRRFADSPVLEWLHVDAWGIASELRLHGVMLAEGAIIRKSKRPTTRLLAFGNERH